MSSWGDKVDNVRAQANQAYGEFRRKAGWEGRIS